MKNQKKKLIAVLAGAAVAAAVSASAATLGGITGSGIGANSAVVGSPVEKGVVVAWETDYSASADAYVVTDVSLSTRDRAEAIPATAEVKLTVTGKDGAELGEYVSIDGGSTWEVKPTTAIPAAAVLGVAVVIDGGETTAVQA